MIFLWVRAKRDLPKIKLVVNRYLKNWNVVLKTLKTRSFLKKEFPFDFSKYNIVILGSEDNLLYNELKDFKNPLFGVNFVNSKQVRREKVSNLFKVFEYIRSEMRNSFVFENDYFLAKGESNIYKFFPPDLDAYFLYPQHAENLKNVLNLNFEFPYYSLIYREGLVEKIYMGKGNFLEILKPDEGEIKVLSKISSAFDSISVNWDKTVERNSKIIENLEKEVIDFLYPYKDEKVVIPLSGGKDSEVVLSISAKVFKKENLRAVYIDTGFDFKENRESVLELCEHLKVKLDIVELRLDLIGEPDRSRWCTKKKTEAIYKKLFEYGSKILIAGDRDGESFKRRRRPRKKLMHGILHLYPIKFWSMAFVQLYIELNNLPINPLYLIGFWRTGCKNCPFLTQWERILKEIK